ncbi:hypothetical protein MBLNU459_g5784t1 [Dothideomycetes sp. NU459]
MAMSQHAGGASSNHISNAASQHHASGQMATRDNAALLPQNSSSRSSARAAQLLSRQQTSQQRKLVPSPLQATHSYESTSALKSPAFFSPTSPAYPASNSALHQTNRRGAGADFAPVPVDSPRAAPRRVSSDEAFDQVKAAASRDAVLEQAAKSRSGRTKNTAPDSRAPPSPTVSEGLPTPTASRMASFASSARQDSHPAIQRTVSIDSTVSSLSSSTSQTFRLGQPGTTEALGAQDIPGLIAVAGSPENAILKLLQEKQSAAGQTAQLWRLVEKQRAMILGLNKDLERTLKDKERYRRKLKEHLAGSDFSQPLPSAALSESLAREDSQSPVLHAAQFMDLADHRRQNSDATDAASLSESQSMASPAFTQAQSPDLQKDSPRSVDSCTIPSITEIHNPRSQYVPDPPRSMHQVVSTPAYRIPTGTPPQTPGLPLESPRTPHTFNARQSAEGPQIAPPQGFSSPKERATPVQRKPPPAPLDLYYSEPGSRDPTPLTQQSDSELEDLSRGRQKTRAQDDKQREAFASRENEHWSQTRKEKKSKSKGAPAVVPASPKRASTPRNSSGSGSINLEDIGSPGSPHVAQVQTYHSLSSIASSLGIAHSSEKSAEARRLVVGPGILSPGLPMSPRPGDRPMNSPMPRAPKQTLTSIPMAPMTGGLPLSPRAPRQPIPLPPQTPLSLASPHLQRAEGYHRQVQSSLGERLAVPSQASTEPEQVPTNAAPRSPGEIYRGLVSEQYPGLLLPPNALPSIFLKVDSSRLRPSRHSYMAPKQSEENPVFTLAVFARSDESQLWRVEKTLAALAVFDEQIKAVSKFRTMLPERGLFIGHAPARIDARRAALGTYFDSLLDTPMDDEAALIICGFLTADAIAAEIVEYFPSPQKPTPTAQSALQNGYLRKDGYLTKRGKNFGGWKARYFVSDGPALKYFEAPGGAQLGSIRLADSQIGRQAESSPQMDEEDDKQYRHAFIILERKRKDANAHVRHILCAESDKERDAWVECLMQYVRIGADGSDSTSGHRKSQDNNVTPTTARSPRLQKSMNELNRPASRGNASSELDSLRSIPYQNTTAAEAPVMGPIASARGRETPSPPTIGSPRTTQWDEAQASAHPAISGPKNGTVIQNAESWGNKNATPTHVKDKKRSIFGFRGRASSDTAGTTANDHPTIVRPVFGVPLAEVAEFSAPTDVPVYLPAVVYRCIEYLKDKKATSEEGIFRLSGSNIVIKALRERFNTEGDVKLISDEQYYDIHAVASLLKLYLRELPASILTRELHLDFLKGLDLADENAKVEGFNVLVNRLPRANRALVEALCSFLREVVDNEKYNKMSVRNVGIVFAPTLNIPAPLISLFVMDFSRVFGTPVDISNSSNASQEAPNAEPLVNGIRSPRKQMFSDLPTPAYNQTSFSQSDYTQGSAHRDASDTGFNSVQQTYAQLHGRPQGDGGYGNLDDALSSSHSQNRYQYANANVNSNGLSAPTSRQSKRESSTFFMNGGLASPREPSLAQLKEHEVMGGDF